MARILHNDRAPDETVHYTFSGVEFDLGGSAKGSFETDNREVLSNAEVHPWLTVEYPERELIAGEPRRTLADRPDLDALSGVGPNARVPFDPDEIAKVEDAKAAARVNPVALDAQLDQGEAVVIETPDQEIATTLAADEDHDPAKSAKAFKVKDKDAAAAASGQTSQDTAVRPAIDPDTTDSKDKS